MALAALGLLLGCNLAVAAAPAAAANATSLADAPRSGWAAYRVPVVTGRPAPCCDGYGAGKARGVCDLDRDNGFSISSDDPASTAGDELTVYLRFEEGRIDRVRALGAACPIDGATPVKTLAGVTPATSLALLRSLAEASGTSEDTSGHALGAIAYHADADATRTLVDLAAAGEPRKQREDALFWLGQTRGRDGAAEIERTLRKDPDSELRRHATFALSQSDAVDAHAVLVDVARTDRDDEVRAQALFWIAQGGDPRAKDAILAVIANDASEHVQEQGVFALSQLKPGGDEALAELVRGNASREVKKKALFWLGQSGSDAAVRLLDDVLAEADRNKRSRD